MKQDNPKRPRQAKAAAKDAPSPIKRSAPEPVPAPASAKRRPEPDARATTSVHPAPTTPASQAEPGAAALTSIAAIAVDPPAGRTFGRDGAASRERAAASGDGRAQAKSPVETVANAASNAVLSVPTSPLPLGTQEAVQASLDQARAATAQVKQASENVGQAVTESASTAAKGLVEFNGKMFDLWRAQSDAAFRVWRSVMTAGSLAEAIRAKTSGMREIYEMTLSQWKELAETTGQLARDAAKPVQPPRR